MLSKCPMKMVYYITSFSVLFYLNLKACFFSIVVAPYPMTRLQISYFSWQCVNIDHY